MSLIGWMIRSSLGTQPTSVALFMGDREVSGSGYRRVPVRRWKLTDAGASTVVAFGPYDGPVSYDRYVIFSGEERLDVFPEESTVQMPRGFKWEWDTAVNFG